MLERVVFFVHNESNFERNCCKRICLFEKLKIIHLGSLLILRKICCKIFNEMVVLLQMQLIRILVIIITYEIYINNSKFMDIKASLEISISV